MIYFKHYALQIEFVLKLEGLSEMWTILVIFGHCRLVTFHQIFHNGHQIWIRRARDLILVLQMLGMYQILSPYHIWAQSGPSDVTYKLTQ
jgi:hypothetical protein